MPGAEFLAVSSETRSLGAGNRRACTIPLAKLARNAA
jgi:hypothetical protein